MRDYMTIIRTVGGNVTRLKQLCTSPTHFRNILSDELLRFAADPSARFIYEEIPLQEVSQRIAKFERPIA